MNKLLFLRILCFYLLIQNHFISGVDRKKSKKNVEIVSKNTENIFKYPENSKISLTQENILLLRDETKEAFLHSYNSYLQYGYPFDEVMPLSCQPRYSNYHCSITNFCFHLLIKMICLCTFFHIAF